jgi:hypothetical protein
VALLSLACSSPSRSGWEAVSITIRLSTRSRCLRPQITRSSKRVGEARHRDLLARMHRRCCARSFCRIWVVGFAARYLLASGGGRAVHVPKTPEEPSASTRSGQSDEKRSAITRTLHQMPTSPTTVLALHLSQLPVTLGLG